MMKATHALPQRSDRVTTFKAWLNVNPAVNLIQLIIGLKMVFLTAAFVVLPVAASDIWRFGAIMLLLVGVWGTARWMGRRYGETVPSQAVYLWIFITVCLIQSITIISQGAFPRLLYVVPTIIAVFHLGQRTSLGVSLATIFWLVVNHQLFPVEQSSSSQQTLLFLVIIYLTGHALAYTLLQERRARKQAQALLGELAESNEQLTRYSAEVAELATIRERNRIAREIHDNLGHYLTIVGVQLEKAIMLDTAAPEEAGQAVKAAKHLADQALTAVRDSVGTLRETDKAFTLQAALQGLVNNIEQAGLSVALRWRGDEAGFTKQQLMTLFRAAQEGLTNVQKHAKAQQAWLDVSIDAEGATLKLEDDGVGFDPTSEKKNSYGLQGLRERVKLVDGRLTLTKSPSGGAQLAIMLPKKDLL